VRPILHLLFRNRINIVTPISRYGIPCSKILHCINTIVFLQLTCNFWGWTFGCLFNFYLHLTDNLFYIGFLIKCPMSRNLSNKPNNVIKSTNKIRKWKKTKEKCKSYLNLQNCLTPSLGMEENIWPYKWMTMPNNHTNCNRSNDEILK
jgi:hypothetical protein